MNLENQIVSLAKAAKKAAFELSLISTEKKNRALMQMAKALSARADFLIKENKKDLQEANQHGYSKALIDRLSLNEKRIADMAQCLTATAKLKDPVGEILQTIKRPNGLLIEKVRTPIGVIGIIYESRPNVTSDCIGLCLKSGNAVILKGGKEAIHSNKAIFLVIQQALGKTKIPAGSIQLVESTDRKAVEILLRMDKYV